MSSVSDDTDGGACDNDVGQQLTEVRSVSSGESPVPVGGDGDSTGWPTNATGLTQDASDNSDHRSSADSVIVLHNFDVEAGEPSVSGADDDPVPEWQRLQYSDGCRTVQEIREAWDRVRPERASLLQSLEQLSLELELFRRNEMCVAEQKIEELFLRRERAEREERAEHDRVLQDRKEQQERERARQEQKKLQKERNKRTESTAEPQSSAVAVSHVKRMRDFFSSEDDCSGLSTADEYDWGMATGPTEPAAAADWDPPSAEAEAVAASSSSSSSFDSGGGDDRAPPPAAVRSVAECSVKGGANYFGGD